MSNINELNQKIAFLNAECQRVNNERAVNMGKHDTLSKQLATALSSYNEKYGKNITVETLEEEIKAVMSAKEKEIASLEAVLNAIKSGDFNTANNLVNGVVSEAKVEAPVQAETPVQVEVPKVEAPVIETPVSPATPPIATPTFVAPSNPEPVTPPVVPPVVEPVTPPVIEPVAPVAPPVVEPVAPPVAETITPPPVMSAPPQMTPPPVAAPNGAPKSFAAILGGTAFEQ